MAGCLVAFVICPTIPVFSSHQLSQRMADVAFACSICSLVLTSLYSLSAVVNLRRPLHISTGACFVNACILTPLAAALVAVVKKQLLQSAIFLSRTSLFLISFVDVSRVFCYYKNYSNRAVHTGH